MCITSKILAGSPEPSTFLRHLALCWAPPPPETLARAKLMADEFRETLQLN